MKRTANGQHDVEVCGMQHWLSGLLIVGLLLTIVLFRGFIGGPRAGETVYPVLSAPSAWPAGGTIVLGARLHARHLDSSKERALDFQGIPSESNPQASVTFFDGEQPLETVEVSLSHRC
jgi:hypothetical protein